MPMNFERSLITEALVSILRGVNDEISYEAMAKRAHTTIEEVRSVSQRARRILLNEKIEFAPIHGKGLKRMNEGAKAYKTEANKKKLGRAANRAEKHAARIDLSQLPPAEQLMVTSNRTVFGLMKRQSRLKPDAKQPTSPPPSTDTTNLVNLAKKKTAG